MRDKDKDNDEIGIGIENQERNEANAFDREVLREFGIESLDGLNSKLLILPAKRIAVHLNAKRPPSSPYRFALYQLQDLRNKKVLDYCAGTGETTVIAAKKKPEFVEAFDLSPLAVEVAKRRMAVNKVHSLVNFQVMSAYSLRYPNNYFDVVFGNAALHHLELGVALKEILRVLKRGGKAIFREPFAGSNVLANVRKLIPIKGRVSPQERQLNAEDILLIKEGFSSSQVQYMGLFSRIDRIIKMPVVIERFAEVDVFIMKHFAYLRKFARSFIITLIK